MATQFVGNLAVEIEGDGSPIVCVHGLGGSSNTWTPLMRAMQGHRTIRIDLPGSGRSSRLTGELSIARLAEAVLNVCHQLDITQAHFVGHSLGTIVCQYIATHHRQQVLSLALFGPFPCPPEAGRPGILARADKAATGGAIAMQEIADAIVVAATSKETREQQPAVVALIRESVMRQSPEGYSENCKALAVAEGAALEEISVPTLLVTGDQDGVAPPAVVAAMKDRIAGSRMVVLEGCGHWTTFEKPYECARELVNFHQSAM